MNGDLWERWRRYWRRVLPGAIDEEIERRARQSAAPDLRALPARGGRPPGKASPPATWPPPWYRRKKHEAGMSPEERAGYAPGLFRPHIETPEEREARLEREARAKRLLGPAAPATGAIWALPEVASAARRFFWPTPEEGRERALREREAIQEDLARRRERAAREREAWNRECQRLLALWREWQRWRAGYTGGGGRGAW